MLIAQQEQAGAVCLLQCNQAVGIDVLPVQELMNPTTTGNLGGGKPELSHYHPKSLVQVIQLINYTL